MNTLIAIAAPDGGGFETPSAMIAAVRAYREWQARLDAEEEEAANAAMREDPAVRAWVRAAVLENAAGEAKRNRGR